MAVSLFGGNQEVYIKWWNFPAGERGVKILNPDEIERYRSFTVTIKYESDQDFMDMLLLVNSMRSIYYKVSIRLSIPYFPYARQDRLMVNGESFSLQVAAQLINSCDFWEVEVVDPHSDVLSAFFAPGKLKVMHQWDVLYPLLSNLRNTLPGSGDKYNIALLSPDAGALKKIYKLASLANLPVVEAGKVRDVTDGKIVGCSIKVEDLMYDNLILVDDIIDGGAGAIELAKTIRTYDNTVKLHTLVSHGIFSKGIDCLKEHFENVLCYNDMRTNK